MTAVVQESDQIRSVNISLLTESEDEMGKVEEDDLTRLDAKTADIIIALVQTKWVPSKKSSRV